MGTYVTDTGFQKKTLVEIKEELETEFQSVLGNDIDLGAQGPIGQLIGLLSQRESNLWDAAEEIYTSRDPRTATGVSLDNISAETGVRRIDSTPTTVSNVLLYGDEGTIIPIDSKAKQSTQDLNYSLVVAVTITKTAAREVQLEFDDPSAGGVVYTVTIESTPYTYTSSPGDTVGDVIDDLVSSITGGSWDGVASNIDDIYLKLLDVDTDFNVTWTATMTQYLLASGGSFEADETGENALSANSLTVIVTPVSGWDSINNPQAGVTGREVETDQELRIRREQTFLAGNATDEAIRSALLNEVDNVQSASVVSNRTMVTDSENRPPKSFEAIVEGGDDDDIANKIWTTMPSGIESYGSTSVIIQDSEGNNQTIKFSRPEQIYIYVKVKRDFYNEEEYPTDGDDQIKEKIVEWSLLEYNPGVDVIRQRLAIPIYEVPGIGEIEITIDGIPSPGGTPTYAEQNIDINARQLAVFDISRIVVEDLTP